MDFKHSRYKEKASHVSAKVNVYIALGNGFQLKVARSLDDESVVFINSMYLQKDTLHDFQFRVNRDIVRENPCGRILLSVTRKRSFIVKTCSRKSGKHPSATLRSGEAKYADLSGVVQPH